MVYWFGFLLFLFFNLYLIVNFTYGHDGQQQQPSSSRMFMNDNDSNVTAAPPKLICYYNFPPPAAAAANNANQLLDTAGLQPEEIDAHLCTHIIVSFATVRNCTISLSDQQLTVLTAVTRLKRLNPQLTVMLSVGGAGGAGGFSDMVANHTTRQRFIASLINVASKQWHMDGIDMDWEFPGQMNRVHFAVFLLELRRRIHKRQECHPKWRFVVSVAVPASRLLTINDYDAKHMNKAVDFVNVMSYDYHFYTDLLPVTGLNAPLYEAAHDLPTLNINSSMSFWHKAGVDRHKLVVGLPTYGHSFQLRQANNSDLSAPSSGYGCLGNFVCFPDICKFLRGEWVSKNCAAATAASAPRIVHVESVSSFYAVAGTEWLSYDNVQSLTEKAKYAIQQHYGGVMMYSLNADDYHGVCHNNNNNGQRFPLISSVKEALF